MIIILRSVFIRDDKKTHLSKYPLGLPAMGTGVRADLAPVGIGAESPSFIKWGESVG